MQEGFIGSVMAGYRIEEVVGRGGMGIVYRATDVMLQRAVALKVIAPDLTDQPKFRERFARELRYVASIDHPNVIPIHHAGEHDGVLFVVMRYVIGTDLGTVLFADEYGLEARRAADIVGQVAAGLDAAHARGVVHRDVKPGNVLLEDRGDREHVYLTDFGLSKHTTSIGGLTATGQFVGTVDYIAPEQIDDAAVDARADVYALGCLLFHALSGHSPYVRDNQAATLWAHMYDAPPSLRQRRPGLAALDPVIHRALEKRPEDRYGSAGEFARAVLEAMETPAHAGERLPSTSADRPDPTAPPRSPAPALATAADDAQAPAPAPAAGHPDGERPNGVRAMASRGSRAGRRRASPVIVGAFAALSAVAAMAVLTLPGGGSGPGESGPRVLSTISVGANPSDVAVGPDAVWVANASGGALTRIDPGSERARSVRAGSDPSALAVGEGALWVADALNRLDRLDPRTGRRLGPARRLSTDPYDVAVGDGAVWLPNGLKDTVTRLDARAPARSGMPIAVGQTPVGVAVADGTAWVVNADSRSVTRIDAATGELRGTPITVGDGPSGIALGLGSAWVTNADSDSVTRIDARTGRVRGRPIAVGRRPSAVAVGAGSVWVANAESNSVSRIDPRTAEVLGRPIPVGESPSAVAVGAGAVWVANADSNDVSRIRP